MPDDAPNESSQQLATAIEAVKDHPDDVAGWDRVEDLVDSVQRPTDVSELFKGVMQDELPAELASDIMSNPYSRATTS